MARPQIVTDEHIRQAVLDLVCEGVSPVTAQVRRHLITKHGFAGNTSRIARVTSEVVTSLGHLMRTSVANPNVPPELVEQTSNLVTGIYAMAVAHVEKSYQEARGILEKESRDAVARAEAKVTEAGRKNDTLGGQLKQAKERILELETREAGLATRNENLTGSLKVVQVELGNANKRILELEETLNKRPLSPELDMDKLVERLTQAVKGKDK